MTLPLYTLEQYRKKVAPRTLADFATERQEVIRIIEEVRRRGDAALQDYTRRFDGVFLDRFKVSEAEYAAAEKAVAPELVEAIRGAQENIARFHRRQVERSWWESGPGWLAGQRLLPLRSVGAYVPGGTAAYPSSVLMTVVPARVAGVKEIYLCTPPDAEGKIHPLTLLAAKLAGVTAVFKVGGAQAVAALAYGTETIPAVQKIVGPGNIFVTLAKREVYGTVGIDLLAGPSEIVIVADEAAEPSYIAADLLSQAEHDPLAAPILVSCSRVLAEAVRREIEAQLARLPRREIAEKALRGQGAAILVPSLAEAWAVVNELAPEHLELHLTDPWSHLDQIENAGAIFIGPLTPEPVGDYWAGSNHVLPTGRGACYASPLGVPDFLKRSHVVYYSAAALRYAAPHVEALARAEGLEAHARAIAIRRMDIFDPQRQD